MVHPTGANHGDPPPTVNIMTIFSSSQPAQKEACRLRGLPAELRNDIYELALSPNETEGVELQEASPPSKSLLLSCRQIYDEAASLQRQAYRQYWETTMFHHQQCLRQGLEC